MMQRICTENHWEMPDEKVLKAVVSIKMLHCLGKSLNYGKKTGLRKGRIKEIAHEDQ